jgi:hypothetical protein
MTIQLVDSTHLNIKPADGYLPAGSFAVKAFSASKGYALSNPKMIIKTFSSSPTGSTTVASFIGGKAYDIIGSGFITNSIYNNQITVCGLNS